MTFRDTPTPLDNGAPQQSPSRDTESRSRIGGGLTSSGKRRYIPLATDICAAALCIGPLVRERHHGWRFKGRMFATHTVHRLIASGRAVRIGDEVRAA